jgi:hypothetical protein
MKLTFSSQVSTFAVSDTLLTIIQKEIENKSQAVNSVTINFRSPSYSAERGGYHPVEVHLIKSGNSWLFDYITDFTYVGLAPMAELAKEIDFCFDTGDAYHLYIGKISIEEGKNLFKLWQSNFVSYWQMKVFDVEVTID